MPNFAKSCPALAWLFSSWNDRQGSLCRLRSFSELTAFTSRSVAEAVNKGWVKNWANLFTGQKRKETAKHIRSTALMTYTPNCTCVSRLFPEASLVKASAPESRSATQVAPLEISIATIATDMLLLRPAVHYSSQSFTPSLSQCHLTTELYSRPLKSSYFEVYTDTKYAWYNSFSFHAATKTLHAKITQSITLCTVHTQKIQNVYNYCEVLLFFSTKQHIYITTSICLLQEALI